MKAATPPHPSVAKSFLLTFYSKVLLDLWCDIIADDVGSKTKRKLLGQWWHSLSSGVFWQASCWKTQGDLLEGVCTKRAVIALWCSTTDGSVCCTRNDDTKSSPRMHMHKLMKAPGKSTRNWVRKELPSIWYVWRRAIFYRNTKCMLGENVKKLKFVVDHVERMKQIDVLF